MNPEPVARRRRGRPPARFRRFRQRHPETAFWLTAGLVPRAALALARAGVLSLTDLEARTPEDLVAIPGVGAASVDLLAELLGRLRPGRRPFPEDRWRQLGIPPEAAITFVQVGLTLERLRSITREELLALPRVGPATLRACELLLGRSIPSGRPARRLEAILGSEIPARPEYWLRQGFSLYVAHALLRVNVHTREELESMTRGQFLALPGVGLYVLARCEKLLGRKLP